MKNTLKLLVSAKSSFNSFSLFARANLTSFGSPEFINFDGGKTQFIFANFSVSHFFVFFLIFCGYKFI